jgi:hypothetical protein
MANPFRYRPDQQPDIDHDGKVVDDWEDNALSNAMAWASLTFTPNWCQTPEHWTSRFALSLFTTCPCCMIFRGLTLGFIIGSALWVNVMLIVIAMILS